MAEEAISALEKAIRDKAKYEAEQTFRRAYKSLFTAGHSGTWTKAFKYEDMKELDLLANRFLYQIVIPEAEKKAVKSFLETYHSMLVQFPSLVEEAAQDGQS